MTPRLATLLVALAASGCSDPNGFDDCTTVLSPSSDPDQNHDALQTALGDGTPGARICLSPGNWPLKDELTLTTPDVELRGSLRGGTVLDFAGQKSGANGLNVSADGFKLWWITVKNTAGDAVRISKAKGVTMREVTVTWDAGRSTSNGGYGLYPTEASQVVIDHCTVSFASDAGIYVGQSNQIVVRNSEVHGNVAGIEIENSFDADVYDNFAHDNTAGILVLNLPHLPQKNCVRVNVHDNLVTGNNGMSFAAPGAIVGQLPRGTGLMVLASDESEVHDNRIEGNDSIGIGLLSYLITSDPFSDDTGYDPYPEGNYIHDNSLSGNGTDPHDIAATLLAVVTPGGAAAEQILWDGATKTDSARNCFGVNGATFRDLDYTGNYQHSSTDPAPYTCVGTPLPRQPDEYPLEPAPKRTFVPKPKLSDYGYFVGAPSAQKPAPGVVPYDVNASLFADGAGKQRFLVLPQGKKIQFDAAGRWQFPDGTVFLKTFYYDSDARNPGAGRRLLETRLEAFNDGVWTLNTYLWDDAQTDATRLVPGRTLHVSYTDANGQPVALDYRVPSTDQCLTCHAQNRAAVPLGPRTRQLNRNFDYGSGAENQLTHLAGLGAFDVALPAPATLEKLSDPFGTDPLDARARSYLDANCAHCHSAGGAASSTSLRLNFENMVAIDLGICRPPNAAGPGSGQLLYDVVPGKPDESIVIFRMKSTAPEIKMPQLPTTTSDANGVSLISQWIASLSNPACAP
jgi:parallel beta-helix repeat protein